MEEPYLELARLLRSYALRRYGVAPVAFTLHFSGWEGGHREPPPVVPLLDWPARPPATPSPRPEGVPGPAPSPASPPTASVSTWASGPKPKHLADFSHVYWPGVGRFALSPAQARVVARLWAAYEAGEWEVPASELQEEAGTESNVYQLFRASPAWKRLVLCVGRGVFRLPELP